MTLSFSQKINGKPNGFVEKISVGLYAKGIISLEKLVELSREPKNPLPVEYYFLDSARCTLEGVIPKYHTFRWYRKTKDGEKSKNQWKAGMDIHPVINNRTKDFYQFLPTIKCVSVQDVHIVYEDGKPNVYIDKQPFYFHTSRNTFGEDKMLRMAYNDGFPNMEAFFNYFKEDFIGNIIHWTDLKY